LALFGMMGAITHGLIDACTSYGTLLYWPISHHRESWDIISIIDPIFTLPLVLLTLIAFILRRPRFAQFAVALCLIYLSLGIYQRGQATQIAAQIAEERDHRPKSCQCVRPWLTFCFGVSFIVPAISITSMPYGPRPFQSPSNTQEASSMPSAKRRLR
jgi:hypothetical protein